MTRCLHFLKKMNRFYLKLKSFFLFLLDPTPQTSLFSRSPKLDPNFHFRDLEKRRVTSRELSSKYLYLCVDYPLLAVHSQFQMEGLDFIIFIMLKDVVTSFPTVLVDNFLPVAIVTCIALLVLLKFGSKSQSKKLPPLCDTGLLEIMGILSKGKGAPDYYQSVMNKLGLVFRLPLPEKSPWIVICDPGLTRRILNEEDEKPALYSRYRGFTNGVINVFTAQTHSDFWKSARKGMAPSFSMANICLSLPKMYEKIDDLKKILARHETEKTVVDLPELLTQLTMDFICAGKYHNHPAMRRLADTLFLFYCR